MSRWIINTLILISLPLCALTMAAWVRSYLRFDDVVRVSRFHVTNICSLRGRLFLQFGWSTFDAMNRSARRYSAGGWFWDSASTNIGYPAADQSRGWKVLGFDVYAWARKDNAGRATAGERVVIVPYWSIFLLTAAAPGWSLLARYSRRKQQRRRERGLCPRCGYDMRATPDRCPECGTIPANVTVNAE